MRRVRNAKSCDYGTIFVLALVMSTAEESYLAEIRGASVGIADVCTAKVKLLALTMPRPS